jgi:hypothetical protein
MVILTINIEQVAWNKSSLLMKIQRQNTQTLQLFTEIIKTGHIYKSNLNAKLEGLVGETKWSDEKREEVQAL